MIKATETFLTVVEFGKRIRLGRTTAQRLVREGHVASVRVANKVLIPESAVEAFLNSNYRAPFDAKTAAATILSEAKSRRRKARGKASATA